MDRRKKVMRYFDENRDFMDSYVKTQIEHNRKGNVKISIKDKEGKPLSGVAVKIKQKKSRI